MQATYRTKKSLGQNFLKDKAALKAIANAAEIGPEDLVIEIGPGQGALSEYLAPLAGKLILIELDSDLIPYLRAALIMRENAEIIQGDILKTDLNAIIKDWRKSMEPKLTEEAGPRQAAPRVHVIGNLPYYITTPIIMKLLEETSGIDDIVIMMQKEVAERLEAEPGSHAYGAITLAVQYYAKAEKVADVPRTSFRPEPKVDSRVLRLDIRSEKPVALKSEKAFFDCVKAGFGQRRKTLLNALSAGLPMEKDMAARLLREAGIDERRRAETLSMEEFARLANLYAALNTTNI